MKDNLTAIYDDLYREFQSRLRSNDIQPDLNIDNIHDNRYGISLIIKPSQTVTQSFLDFQDAVRAIEPQQYFYAKNEIHITVLSLISCRADLKIHDVSINDYRTVIQSALDGIPPFTMTFRGVSASDTAMMIQGFPQTNTLDTLRNRLRIKFQESGLFQTIDERYRLSTAHATVIRLRKEISSVELLIQVLNKYIGFEFGTLEVDSLSLTYNDWYHKYTNVEVLDNFALKPLNSQTVICP